VLNWKRTVGLILLVAGIVIISLGYVSAMLSLGTLTMHITDVMTGEGIEGAYVYVFEGGGGVEPPENGTFIGVTDSAGRASADLGGFYRVGVIAENYVNIEGQGLHVDNDVYSYFGACGVNRDITYSVELIEGGGPTVPVDPYNPDGFVPVDNGEEDEPEITEPFSVPLTVAIVGAVVSCCGVGFIAVDKYVD